MPEAFTIEFTETAATHLALYKNYDSNRIFDAIKIQLTYEHSVETRNRKLLQENPLADWELRVEMFRVFYEVNWEERTVRIIAVGHKEKNKLFIGGEEIEL